MDEGRLHDLAWSLRRTPGGSRLHSPKLLDGSRVEIPAEELIDLVELALIGLTAEDGAWRETEAWHNGYGDAMDDLNSGDIDYNVLSISELDAVCSRAQEAIARKRPRAVEEVDTKGRT